MKRILTIKFLEYNPILIARLIHISLYSWIFLCVTNYELIVNINVFLFRVDSCSNHENNLKYY